MFGVVVRGSVMCRGELVVVCVWDSCGTVLVVVVDSVSGIGHVFVLVVRSDSVRDNAQF